MTTLTPDAWAQVRHDYEHSAKLIEDICAEHGICATTLNKRARRWGWTPRRMAVPREGPLPAPAPQREALVPPPASDAPPLAATPQDAPAVFDKDEIGRRLQGALGRVLPAIEATLGQLATNATQPREIERASRALTALTRTLHELNALASRFPAPDDNDRGPKDDDEFFRGLLRRIERVAAGAEAREAASGTNAE